MFWNAITLSFLLILCVSVLYGGKVKVVDEPFSFHSGANSMRSSGRTLTGEAPLVSRHDPFPISGPQYLIDQLNGKCFEKIINNYKYSFCPYHNITQREQSHRWNAFHGFLGVFREWSISNDSFTAMRFDRGDACAGTLDRETRALMRCGNRSVIVEVNEPSMCRYELVFETPHACPKDVFEVYPMLTESGRKRWLEIEEDMYSDELTPQGYQKQKMSLYTEEGLTGRKEPDKVAPVQTQAEEKRSYISSIPSNVKADGIFFSTRQQCSDAYMILLEEVKNLRANAANKSLAEANLADKTLAEANVANKTLADAKLIPVKNLVEDVRGEASKHNESTDVSLNTRDDLHETVNKITDNITSKLDNITSKSGMKLGRHGDQGQVDEHFENNRALHTRMHGTFEHERVRFSSREIRKQNGTDGDVPDAVGIARASENNIDNKKDSEKILFVRTRQGRKLGEEEDVRRQGEI